MNSGNIHRVVRGYEKDGEALVTEVSLESVDLAVLQRIFQLPEDDPMYDCYPIAAAQLRAIQRYLNRTIDLSTCDFFLECDRLE